MAIKQKKTEPVVFNTPRDLLIAMIIGRRFKYEEGAFHFDKKDGTFKSSRWGSFDTSRMCELLVGKKLVDVDPQFIPVDTLLLVSDSEVLKNRKTPMKPAIPQYFSHWSEGKLYCFAEGTTSLTAKRTTGWRYWEFAKEAK